MANFSEKPASASDLPSVDISFSGNAVPGANLTRSRFNHNSFIFHVPGRTVKVFDSRANSLCFCW